MNELERKHRDLLVWQEAVNFTTIVYQVTASFPSAERFGLTSQMRRASVSIAANIAEGAARKSTKELLQFVSIARASAAEVDTLLEISSRVGLIAEKAEIQIPLDKLTVLLIRFESGIRRKLAT